MIIINHELHAKMAEEIDYFWNFRSSVTLILTLDRVEVALVAHIRLSLPTHQIRLKSDKIFVDRQTYIVTDGWTDLSSNLVGHCWAMTSKLMLNQSTVYVTKTNNDQA